MTDSRHYTVDLGNNETASRGVYPINGGALFVAMTFAESKTFKTERGAIAWLARRGLDQYGHRI